ncbi:MAG: hypothetical protein GF307_04840 [candidate division Zixibacteria bacterium]|nr:hypothetical protein [candidate division Zixibacteria bacterium]
MVLLRCVTFSLLSLLFLFSACSDDDSGTNSNGTNPPVEASIGPAGGTMEMANNVSLTIPAGALNDTVDFRIEVNSAPETMAAPMVSVTSAYTITPSGTQFNVPATIKVHYTDNGLGGMSEDSVVICTHDGSAWSRLTSAVTKDSNFVTASINHLSDFAGFADSTSAPPPAEGVFAILTVQRTIIPTPDTTVSMDMITARFDSAYAPCEPSHPLQPSGVTCDQYQLVWSADISSYKYPALYSDAFIMLDHDYVFDVSEGGGVPALIDSIKFPADSPMLLSPSAGDTVSFSGFDVTWDDPGEGVVDFVFVYSGDTTNATVTTDNDGSYTFTESDLSGLNDQAGEYALVMFHDNMETIDATGYDSRSYKWAVVMNSMLIYIE